MVYEITLPSRTHLRLVRWLGGLSGEEEVVYDSLSEMEKILGDHVSRQVLIDCRAQRFPEIYRSYLLIDGNENKPPFHKWYHDLLKKFDKRIEDGEA